MHVRRTLVPLLIASVSWGADVLRADGPWTEQFTMVLKDTERTFVVHAGTSYLATRPEDFADRDFLVDKDLMIPAKFQHGQGDHVLFYKLEDFDIRSAPEQWSVRVDGDNVYVFAHCSLDPDTGKPVLRIAAMEPAPSDAQLIAARLKDVRKTDWDERIATVAWAREQGAKEGNQEWWLQQADDMLTKLITDAAAQAETAKDFPLALKAMDWAVDQQRDPIAAARIASAAWIRAKTGPESEEVSKRMRRLGMELYREQWRPRAEALELEYDDRFAALPWKDAEGFYKLGRWADANAEMLPQAKDRAYRAYQAGFKANPDHPGIRRELGIDQATSENTVDTETGRLEYRDPITNGTARSPNGWRKAEHQHDGVRWEDPTSDTAYVSERFIAVGEASVDDLWPTIIKPARSLLGYQAQADESIERKGGKQRMLRYTFQEDRLTRCGALTFIIDEATHIGVVVEVSYVEEEREKALKAFDDALLHIGFPKAEKSDKDKDKDKDEKTDKGAKTEKSAKDEKPEKSAKDEKSEQSPKPTPDAPAKDAKPEPAPAP
jgi:hypothetical protein